MDLNIIDEHDLLEMLNKWFNDRKIYNFGFSVSKESGHNIEYSETDVGTLERQVRELESENEDLGREVDDLEDDVSDLEDEVEDLKKERDALLKKVEELENSNVDAKVE